jgi:hypothetical protein
MTRHVHAHLAEVITDERWARWAARLSLTVAIDATMTWLDIGGPEPDLAVHRIDQVVQAVLTAVTGPESRPTES